MLKEAGVVGALELPLSEQKIQWVSLLWWRRWRLWMMLFPIARRCASLICGPVLLVTVTSA